MIASPRSLPLAAGLLSFAACLLSAGCRTPGARPIAPAIDSEVKFSARIPDVADYAAADLASAALVSDHVEADRMLRRLRAIDTVLVSGGEHPTGLVPAATDLVNATSDSDRRYRAATRVLLEEDSLDPALRARLSQSEQDDPLSLADARIRDARMISFARAFNSLAEPIGQSLLTTTLAPYRLARSLLRYALQLYVQEPLPLQRRQALAHWKEFVARYPNTPESVALRPRIESADRALNETRYDRMLAAAKRALEVGQTRLALVYADQALRLLPEDVAASELREEADQLLLEQRANRSRSVEGARQLAVASPPARRLSVELLIPDGEVATASRELLRADPNGPLADEARFAGALARGEAGEEQAMWQELEDLADGDLGSSNMARHARALILDPESNPYAAFRTARSHDRKVRAKWVLLGPWARGFPDRGLPRPVEWIIGLPAIAQSLFSSPIRLIQLPWMDILPAARLAAVYGRRYLDLWPSGDHAGEIRGWLAAYEKKRKNWIAVYHIAMQDPETDPEKLAKLREKAASQARTIAAREQRSDLRNAMYRRVAQEYPDTEAGREAGEAAGEEILESTPQRIQISRGFLLENPEFAGPRGLALEPQLLDGDPANGELHESGLSLIGGRSVELRFVGPTGDEDDPPIIVYQRISEERFALMVSRLEETAFRNALLDSDDVLAPDANRDVFFERARVGLADEIDPRPMATSNYLYQGVRERYGMVRSRESILPFDLVIQGSLADLSLGAFPRIRQPRETPDAFLYR